MMGELVVSGVRHSLFLIPYIIVSLLILTSFSPSMFSQGFPRTLDPQTQIEENITHTLAAHLVTFLPSLIHFMYSSLNSLHRAPMKKLADSKGAEEEPISGTLGTESGRGVVSMRTDWLNLCGEEEG